MGKLSAENLKKLLECIKKDARVVVPPMPGFDSGVHLIDDKCMVVSTDPCIGVPIKWFGWLLVNYAASDVALFGAKPEFCTINLLAPPLTRPQVFQRIMIQACQAANQIKTAIVTGHTGTYDGLSTVVGVSTAYGIIDKDRLITPSGAKPGDNIYCLKPIGLETIVNLTLTRMNLAKKLFGSLRTRELIELVPMQSCVKEALALARINGVRAMHDTTEGGLTAALNEMADGSGVGFKTEFEKIPFCKEVRTLQTYFNLSQRQLLSLSSTGTILAAVTPKAKNEVDRILRKNQVQASIIGSFTRNPTRLLKEKQKQTCFPNSADDPYARILSGKL
jgi:hydrogenase expression/formation protein HypE